MALEPSGLPAGSLILNAPQFQLDLQQQNPLSPCREREDFFFALKIIPTDKKIAVAVSGGADSFALLHMAKLQNFNVTAFTVDHQLRPESAAEAKAVAEWCASQNIEHHTLLWQGEKPTTAIQAIARNARRHLLCRAAQERGIDYLLLGHQADDQAETMLMRMQRGTGLNGLKAMQPVTRDKATNVAILRPLLSIRRAELRQYCLDHNLPFIDDPSNENTDYERVRIRNALQALPDLAGGISKTAIRLNRANETLSRIARTWFDTHAQFLETGKIWLPELNATLPEIRLRILQITCPDATLPQLEKLSVTLDNPGFSGMTLGNIWIKPKIMNKQPGFLFQPAPKRK